MFPIRSLTPQQAKAFALAAGFDAVYFIIYIKLPGVTIKQN
jgi:hypothetical protein